MQGSELVSEIYNTHYPAEPDFQEGAVRFFRAHLELSQGAYACLLQLQLPHRLTKASVRLQAIDAFTRAPLGELRLEASRADLEALDGLILGFTLASDALVEIVGLSTGLGPAPMLRHLRLLRYFGMAPLARQAFRDDRVEFQTAKLNNVLIGATNHCNASCPHCPANKPMLADMPLGVMSMEVFEKLLEGLQDVELERGFWFGVFGEPFLDETLEQKFEMIRRWRPLAHIGVSTNAAAIDLRRAERIFELVTMLQIHAEAVTPARYDALMQPLRAADVLPKIDALVDAFPGRIEIITPFHRGNVTETDLFAERWSAKGVRVDYAAFHNRGASRTGANKLALWPTPGFWTPKLVDVLTVDWDGTVLALCDDFLRRQPLGSLATESLPEILSGSARRTLHEDLSCFRWARLPSMRDATMDSWAKVEAQTRRHDGGVSRQRKFHANAFKIRSDVRCADDLLTVAPPGPDAEVLPVVYGPYLKLPEGRYCVEIDASVREGAPRALVGEVAAFGERVYQQCESLGGAAPLRMSFTHENAETPVEFRVFVEDFSDSVTLAFRGATLFRID